MNKVAIVILNWNGERFLRQFLPSVVSCSADYAEIIVADNASSDNSVAFLQKAYPQIRIIHNDKNYGFSEGYNKALASVESEYYVILNSDIEVSSGWIEPVIELLDSNPHVAVCQPKILSYQDKTKFEYAGGAGGFLDHYGYPFCRGRLFETIETDKGQYDDCCEIFWATGAAMFVRSSVYHELGGLDPDFFAHMEEIDFCWRAKNAGYKIMYCPSSKIYHVGGGTLPKSSSRKTYLNFRNNFSLLFKNLPQNRLVRVIVLRLLLDGVAAFKFLFEGKGGEFTAVLKAHLYFYKHLSVLRKKRRISSQKTVSQMYNRCIVWEYYLRKIDRFYKLDKRFFEK